ncbi:MAG: L-histidine N(alpha)-methyltransferase [Candidatus Rokubacteria bacterium]|nr:L-histidine N(alpha)-methyltransferase [Candidatus Rokubacteria bacterium]MBI3107217.1 L-histidine N(alpha)-methyltransferase [Candidatus Rokubacteria bacterium]
MGCLLDVHADEARFLTRMAEDIGRGLTARPRRLPPKYFYDEAGSALFERITELPEYYLTRAEAAILRDGVGDLVRRLDPRDIVELGPGSCRKVRWLLDALEDGRGVRYVAMDVGRESLAQAVGALADEYPGMHLHAVVADFERHLGCLPLPAGRRLVLFLGSTIGNFDPPARRALLAQVRRLLGSDGRFLLGVDLVKDRRVLEAAYDDAAGVTREFNRNILRVVNRAVDGDFVPGAWRHHSFYNMEMSRIEMHLLAAEPQRVHLKALGLGLDFEAGDGIWTESSYKFTRESVAVMLREAGLALDDWRTDPEGRFGLAIARPGERA